MSQLCEISLADWVDNWSNEAVFLKLKVSLLYIFKKFGPTTLSDEESSCCSATLESDLSCILKVSYEKVLFNEIFMTLVPVSVPWYCLLHEVLWVIVWHNIHSTWTSFDFWLWLFCRFFFHWLRLTSKLVKEIFGTLSGECSQIFSKRIVCNLCWSIKAARWLTIRFLCYFDFFAKVSLRFERNFPAIKAELLE